MRWLRVIAIALVAAILQVSLMGTLRIDTVVPNLALVVVVCISVWGSASEAVLTASIVGLIMDTAGAGIFGLATSSLVLLGLGLVVVRQMGLDGEALPIRLILVAIATVVWGLINISALGIGTLAIAASWRVIGIEALLNCVVALCCTERIFRGPRTV